MNAILAQHGSECRKTAGPHEFRCAAAIVPRLGRHHDGTRRVHLHGNGHHPGHQRPAVFCGTVGPGLHRDEPHDDRRHVHREHLDRCGHVRAGNELRRNPGDAAHLHGVQRDRRELAADGTTGLVCFGHAALFGIGAYTAVLLSPEYESASVAWLPCVTAQQPPSAEARTADEACACTHERLPSLVAS